MLVRNPSKNQRGALRLPTDLLWLMFSPQKTESHTTHYTTLVQRSASPQSWPQEFCSSQYFPRSGPRGAIEDVLRTVWAWGRRSGVLPSTFTCRLISKPSDQNRGINRQIPRTPDLGLGCTRPGVLPLFIHQHVHVKAKPPTPPTSSQHPQIARETEVGGAGAHAIGRRNGQWTKG